MAETKPNVVETKKQIVFSFHYKGKVIELDAREFRFYTSTLLDLKTIASDDGSGSSTMYPILLYYDKDNPGFMPHKYTSRALWHLACEILYQALLEFYRQQSGPQLPGYSTIKGLGKGSLGGSNYAAAWEVIDTLNGHNSSLDYVSVHQAFLLIDYDPRKHDFTHYLKALDNFKSELHKLDASERRIDHRRKSPREGEEHADSGARTQKLPYGGQRCLRQHSLRARSRFDQGQDHRRFCQTTHQELRLFRSAHHRHSTSRTTD